MIAVHPMASCEAILDTMIQLATAARSHRVIVAGSAAFDLCRGLCRRGFTRVAIITDCRGWYAQHDVALVAGHHTMQALERALLRLLPFLSSQATLSIWVDSSDRGRGKGTQLLLEGLGFRIECAAKCDAGFILAARRRARQSMTMVA